MPARRHETQEPPKPEAEPKKPLTPMAEAVKLQGALDKVNKREADAWANAKARYQVERDALLRGASDKAKKILEAAAAEEPEA